MIWNQNVCWKWRIAWSQRFEGEEPDACADHEQDLERSRRVLQVLIFATSYYFSKSKQKKESRQNLALIIDEPFHSEKKQNQDDQNDQIRD